jgi:hypothetical protein
MLNLLARAAAVLMENANREPARGWHEPIMVAAKPFPVLADDSKAVDIAVARSQPVDELNPQLEARLRSPHELGFVELDQLIVFLDRRDGRFANTDGADRFAFDELDIIEALAQLAEEGSRHPPRGSSTNACAASS